MNLKEFENWRASQGYVYLNNSPRQYGDRFYEDQEGNWVNGWTLFKEYLKEKEYIRLSNINRS
jgi:hypothetical protein